MIWIILAILALLMHLAVHEAAHALALRKSLGGDITEAGLGLPIPPQLRIERPNSWTLTLSPWLLGAYVLPDKESERKISEASYSKQAWFAGAGVIANIILGSTFLIALYLLSDNWMGAGIAAGVGVASWFLRKAITFILPLLGIAALVFLIYALTRTVGMAQGPVAIAVLLGEMSTLEQVLKLGANIGFSLAILNCIPVFPFDGGRVADAALRATIGPRIADGFRVVTGTLALGFLVYVLGSDIWSLAT